jgi:hypothetical protein
MPNANWEADVAAALNEQKQAEVQASNVFANPVLAKFCIASGIFTALIAAAVAYASTVESIDFDQRRTFKGFAVCAAITAFTEVTIGVVALLSQGKQPAAKPRQNEPPAIGW